MRKVSLYSLVLLIGIITFTSCSEEESTITVEGKANINVPVDYLSFAVGLSAQGSDVKQLEKSSYQTMLRLKNILIDKWQLPDSLVQTSGSSIDERFNNDLKSTYYRFNQNMTVTLDSLELYETLRRQLLEAGATQCRINNFGTHKKEETEKKALNKAFQNARKKANGLAENADFTIGKIQKISTSGRFNIPDELNEIVVAGYGSQAIPSPLESSIIKKHINVDADVNVIFTVE